MLATVVIPARGRSELLDRTVKSIKNCSGSDDVEIIIIDDFSERKITCEYLTSQDSIVYLSENSGAAVARNIGIDNAKGDLIYLMDSDDYIIERDFVTDHKRYKDTNCLWFSDIQSQGFKSNYPEEIFIKDFFNSIFFKFPHVCQTSSLFFDRKLNIKFDESLPKHQDWDFVLFSALIEGTKVKKGNGTIFFDRGDRKSLSRGSKGDLSNVWYSKLLGAVDRDFNFNQIRYFLFSQYLSNYKWSQFTSNSLKLILTNKASVKAVLIKLCHRLIAIMKLI
ncbi:hypothetical protein PE36_00489 [Moritella sp. PE36]|uniref:glycosyltransferase family A protein n=1 Tax=Moritella sp. PE36 TaxID=58051 RepID=UPI000156817D|nr:glycosyltransferase family A protein [Moritella sp. PE36]EDM67457.1 hypothetical protein PE36_00489 [Moritella sp. PE36]